MWWWSRELAREHRTVLGSGKVPVPHGGAGGRDECVRGQNRITPLYRDTHIHTGHATLLQSVFVFVEQQWWLLYGTRLGRGWANGFRSVRRSSKFKNTYNFEREKNPWHVPNTVITMLKVNRFSTLSSTRQRRPYCNAKSAKFR